MPKVLFDFRQINLENGFNLLVEDARKTEPAEARPTSKRVAQEAGGIG